ncbi:hypothetical protein [Pseudomonas sp. NFX5]|uniref:hypothetical protein n=1 Tax=Pseudomonas sp. NFX5 TaxID=2816961 RepID=UPI003B8ABB03
MSNSSQHVPAKHWFVIDREYEGSLVEWLKKCGNPTFSEGRTIENQSTENQHRCGYEITDGAVPENTGSILLTLYTDVRSLDESFLGALRNHFAPSRSSEPS